MNFVNYVTMIPAETQLSPSSWKTWIVVFV